MLWCSSQDDVIYIPPCLHRETTGSTGSLDVAQEAGYAEAEGGCSVAPALAEGIGDAVGAEAGWPFQQHGRAGATP